MLSQTLISNNYRLQKKQAIKRLMQRQKLFLVHKAGMNALVFKNSTSLSSIFNPPQVLNWAEKQALSFKRGIIRAPSPLLHRQTKYISYFQNVVNTDGPIFYFLNFFSSYFFIFYFSYFQNVVHTDGPAYVCAINNPNEVFTLNDNNNDDNDDDGNDNGNMITTKERCERKE